MTICYLKSQDFFEPHISKSYTFHGQKENIRNWASPAMFPPRNPKPPAHLLRCPSCPAQQTSSSCSGQLHPAERVQRPCPTVLPVKNGCVHSVALHCFSLLDRSKYGLFWLKPGARASCRCVRCFLDPAIRCASSALQTWLKRSLAHDEIGSVWTHVNSATLCICHIEQPLSRTSVFNDFSNTRSEESEDFEFKSNKSI